MSPKLRERQRGHTGNPAQIPPEVAGSPRRRPPIPARLRRKALPSPRNPRLRPAGPAEPNPACHAGGRAHEAGDREHGDAGAQREGGVGRPALAKFGAIWYLRARAKLRRVDALERKTDRAEFSSPTHWTEARDQRRSPPPRGDLRAQAWGERASAFRSRRRTTVLRLGLTSATAAKGSPRCRVGSRACRRTTISSGWSA